MWHCAAVASLTFLGAAQNVTGSRHLLTTASRSPSTRPATSSAERPSTSARTGSGSSSRAISDDTARRSSRIPTIPCRRTRCYSSALFFFQAEDGIRDYKVTGVQTCALPIYPRYVAALQRQIARIHVGSFTTEHRAALVKLLAELAPGDLNRTQFYSSGAEAVEAALRLAKSRTGHTEVIGFWGGFHGKTSGVLPVLGSSFKHALGPLLPGAYLSPYASCARCAFDKTVPSCEWHCVAVLKQKVELETTKDVAAIIVEPIQGTARNIVPPPGYLRVLRRLADELGALLICDEMITGFGRTGKMFAIEHENVIPDVLTVGKGFGGGVPMSGIIAREGIAFAKPFANPSGSSSSYGGNSPPAPGPGGPRGENMRGGVGGGCRGAGGP